MSDKGFVKYRKLQTLGNVYDKENGSYKRGLKKQVTTSRLRLEQTKNGSGRGCLLVENRYKGQT